jgi:predicted NAD/FAD-dependent oxidoreductase
MPSASLIPNVAVIGAGIAGAACAASLRQAGLRVTVFDKSRGIGGRMATRRAEWAGADGSAQRAEFDHGAQHIMPRSPRLRGVLLKAEAAGAVARWRPRVHAAWPAPLQRDGFVPVGQMPALCRHLLGDLPLHLNHPVQRLQRAADGWHLVAADGCTRGPFDQVLLAMPPAQAAVLLAGHQDAWADALVTVRMAPCWTLMAVTQELDWPWDAAEPRQGPLAWVARNDRKPGRSPLPGRATWVAHAGAAWSAAHQDAAPEAVQRLLSQALAALLPAGVAVQWHHRAVQRWRFALPAAEATGAGPGAAAADGHDCWWDAALGLGVCGDFLGSREGPSPVRGVEAGWRSGDELADTLLAALDSETAPPALPRGLNAAAADEAVLAHTA